MNVGPPAFTALAFIGMANGLPNSFDREQDGILDANIIRTFALVAAIFLWSLSLWWFFIAAVAVISSRPKYFVSDSWCYFFLSMRLEGPDFPFWALTALIGF